MNRWGKEQSLFGRVMKVLLAVVVICAVFYSKVYGDCYEEWYYFFHVISVMTVCLVMSRGTTVHSIIRDRMVLNFVASIKMRYQKQQNIIKEVFQIITAFHMHLGIMLRVHGSGRLRGEQ